MLQSIRNRAQGWISWIIIFLLAIAFGFWGIENYLGGGSASGQNVAKVNGISITQNDYNMLYQRLRQSLQQQLGSNFVITPAIDKKLRERALNQLINTALLTQVAAKDGFRVTPSQLDSVVLNLPAFQVDGHFSKDRFQELLNGNNLTEQQFIDQLRSEMLINQVRLGILGSNFALPQEITNAYQLIHQTRDIQYTMIMRERFNSEVNVTPAQIEAYYQSHQAEFKTPEEVSISYISLNLANLEANYKFSDAQLQAYYKNNLDNYTMPKRWHVAHILVRIPKNPTADQLAKAKNQIDAIAKQLKSGEKFKTVATIKSQDIVSSKNGGVLPWFNAGMVGPKFLQAVEQLKPGEVSKPVRTEYGYDIIKLLAVKDKQVRPFSEVKSAIAHLLASQKAEKEFASKSEQLANLTYVNADSLKPAAKALGLKIQTTGLFTRKGEKQGIASHSVVISTAFNSNVLEQGNNSNIINLDSGSTQVVLRVNKHVKASIKPLAKVSDTIKDKLIKQQEQKKAQQLAKTVQQAINSGDNLEKIAKQYKLTWHQAKQITRHDPKIDSAVAQRAFSLPRTKQGNSSGIAELGSGGYAVLVLNHVTDGTSKAMTQDQRKAFNSRLTAALGNLDYELYIKHQREHAKIEVNQ